jgi:hypothetical protein
MPIGNLSESVKLGYCHCGCGSLVNKIGKNYRKYVKNHFRRRLIHYVIDPETNCWNWQLSTNSNGYGMINIEGTHRKAATVYYEFYKGRVPIGLSLDHLCRNRKCINPDHLEPVSNAENIRRGKNAKLNFTAVQEIKSLQASGLDMKSISKLYHVSKNCIFDVLHNITWNSSPAN